MPGNTAHELTFPGLKGRSVFVTGGTGFVGSHFVERLLASGCTDIRCLVRTDPRFLGTLPVKHIRGDLFSGKALDEGLLNVDYVVHIAAVTRELSWSAFREANVDGTTELLSAVSRTAPDVKKVLITSSLAVVGRGTNQIADESSPLLPVSLYGRSKKEMEEAVALYTAKLPLVIVRPPAVYGPRESDIFTFFKTLNTGICPIIGNGRNAAISLVFVEDLVDGMIAALLSPAAIEQTYFLGSPEQYSWHEIRDASATALRRRVLTIPVPPVLIEPIGRASEFYGKITGTYPPLNREKAAEIRHACKMCDSSKARIEFGYSPSTDLWKGIDTTISWYRSEGWLQAGGFRH